MSKNSWEETRREFDIIDGKEVLTKITREKSKSNWYNSSLFLWGLGVLVVSFVPWVWSGIQKQVEKQERIVRIDNEIGGRFTQLFDMITRLSDSTERNGAEISSQQKIDANYVNPNKMFFQFIDAPDKSKDRTKFYASYKEFEDYSTATLLKELTLLVNKQLEKEELKNVIFKIGNPDFVPESPVLDGNKFIENIKSNIFLQRWR